MVSITFTLSPTPCFRCPNLLEKYFTHVFLCLSCFIRCLHSSDSPSSSSVIYYAIILRYWWSVMSSGVSGCGLKWAVVPHHCALSLAIFYVLWGICVPIGVMPYRVGFQPWWWILLFFNWDMVWGCDFFWFSLMSCLGCWGFWYVERLHPRPQRWLGTIVLLFHYFGLCFSCLKFGFWCDLALEYFCKFSKFIKFFCA